VRPVDQPDAFRPRGFTPPRRFTPPDTLRACFIPQPPLGVPPFRGFPSQGAVTTSSVATHALVTFVPASSAVHETTATGDPDVRS
jgi:hypothetical protein